MDKEKQKYKNNGIALADARYPCCTWNNVIYIFIQHNETKEFFIFSYIK
jgi:hypothetical protein